MENNQQRTLAYTLAKTVDNQDLANISGGSSNEMSRQQTVRITGGSGAGEDVAYDVSVDW